MAQSSHFAIEAFCSDSIWANRGINQEANLLYSQHNTLALPCECVIYVYVLSFSVYFYSCLVIVVELLPIVLLIALFSRIGYKFSKSLLTCLLTDISTRKCDQNPSKTFWSVRWRELTTTLVVIASIPRHPRYQNVKPFWISCSSSWRNCAESDVQSFSQITTINKPTLSLYRATILADVWCLSVCHSCISSKPLKISSNFSQPGSPISLVFLAHLALQNSKGCAKKSYNTANPAMLHNLCNVIKHAEYMTRHYR